MATIETVTGPIDAGELGTTLIHEHLRTRDEAVHEQWPQAKASGGIPEREHPGDGYEAAVEVADRRGRARGADDLRPDRDVPRPRRRVHARRLRARPGSRSSPAPGSTPTTTCRRSSSAATPTRSPTCSCADIEQGIQGTEIKAAFIKCAADEPGRDRERREGPPGRRPRQPRAPGRRSWPTRGRRATPRPRQVEIFLEEGVDPAKVQIAHTGDTDDLDYIERLLETGVWIGLDRYGLEMYLPYDRRQATALALLERGYADRIFLSADSCGTIDWFEQAAIEQMLAAGMAKDWDIRIVHRAGAPGPARGGDDRRSGRADHGPQPGRLAHGLSSALRPRPPAPSRPRKTRWVPARPLSSSSRPSSKPTVAPSPSHGALLERLGDEDLAAARLGGDPRREDHAAAEEVALLADRLAGVHAHPHPHPLALDRLALGELALDRRGALDRPRAGRGRRA